MYTIHVHSPKLADNGTVVIFCVSDPARRMYEANEETVPMAQIG